MVNHDDEQTREGQDREQDEPRDQPSTRPDDPSTRAQDAGKPGTRSSS